MTLVRSIKAPLDPSQAEALSALHRRAFSGPDGRWGRGWSADEIASLANSPGALLLAAGEAAAPLGFALFRVAADEAELLTIATDPSARRQGAARALLREAGIRLPEQGASRVFLEVGAKNAGAIALYEMSNFKRIAVRANYYAFSGGDRDDALIYELKFKQNQ